MEKKNNSGLLVGILIGLLIAIIVVGGLFVTGTIGLKLETTGNGQGNLTSKTNSNNSDEVREYSYDKVAGYYEAKINEKTEEVIEGDSGETVYSLYLYENGTFSLRWVRMAPVGFIGNYIIKDNEIILNPMYDTNSGAGKTKTTNKPVTLTISQDETLETDGNTFRKITLKKSTDDLSQNWFDHYLSYEGN